jgi:hypothetical protein
MRIVLVDPSRAVQRAMTLLIEQGGHEVVPSLMGWKRRPASRKIAMSVRSSRALNPSICRESSCAPPLEN